MSTSCQSSHTGPWGTRPRGDTQTIYSQWAHKGQPLSVPWIQLASSFWNQLSSLPRGPEGMWQKMSVVHEWQAPSPKCHFMALSWCKFSSCVLTVAQPHSRILCRGVPIWCLHVPTSLKEMWKQLSSSASKNQQPIMPGQNSEKHIWPSPVCLVWPF